MDNKEILKKIGNKKGLEDSSLKKGVLANIINDSIYTINELFPNIAENNLFICQEKTGYCWLISTLNCIEKYLQNKTDKTFKLSKNFLIFFDKLEKANCFLENIISYIDLSTNSRTIQYLLSNVMTDRGQWKMAQNLIKKYGVIPFEIMTDSKFVQNTGELNASLSYILKYYAIKIRELYKEGKSKKEIFICKNIAMEKVYNLLVRCYGIPPSDFYYSVNESITPLEFYNKYINFPFDEYICICDLGNEKLDYFTEYIIQLDGYAISSEKNCFLNIPQEYFEKVVVIQLEKEGFCWIGCDSGKFYISKAALYDDSIFDFSLIIQEDIFSNIEKHEIYNYHIASNSHALVLCNSVKRDKRNFYLAMDSSINSVKFNGYCAMSDSWFNKYVFQAIIKKDYLKESIKEFQCNQKLVMPWDFFSLS